MRKKIAALFLLLSLFGRIYAENLAEVSFKDDLAVYHQREIKIRGFIYQADNGRVILAEAPDLKSCCVGAQHKVARQLVVTGIEGQATQSTRALVLQGILLREPKEDATGNLVQLYRLDHAKIVSEGPVVPAASVLLTGAAIGGSAFALKRYRGRRKRH